MDINSIRHIDQLPDKLAEDYNELVDKLGRFFDDHFKGDINTIMMVNALTHYTVLIIKTCAADLEAMDSIADTICEQTKYTVRQKPRM